MTLFGHSQSLRNDSTLIPNSQLRIALQKIEMGRQCEEELTLQKKQNDLLYQRISLKDSVIYNYVNITTNKDFIIETYKLSESNLMAQRDIALSTVKALQRKLKAQKTKTFITAVAGVVGIAATFILLK